MTIFSQLNDHEIEFIDICRGLSVELYQMQWSSDKNGDCSEFAKLRLYQKITYNIDKLITYIVNQLLISGLNSDHYNSAHEYILNIINYLHVIVGLGVIGEDRFYELLGHCVYCEHALKAMQEAVS